MTIQEQIRREANNLEKELIDRYGYRNIELTTVFLVDWTKKIFEQGAGAALELANKWISVEDELPNNSDIVLVKYKCEQYELSINSNRLRMNISFYSKPAKRWIIDDNCKVIFWRPVETE